MAEPCIGRGSQSVVHKIKKVSPIDPKKIKNIRINLKKLQGKGKQEENVYALKVINKEMLPDCGAV